MRQRRRIVDRRWSGQVGIEQAQHQFQSLFRGKAPVVEHLIQGEKIGQPAGGDQLGAQPATLQHGQASLSPGGAAGDPRCQLAGIGDFGVGEGQTRRRRHFAAN